MKCVKNIYAMLVILLPLLGFADGAALYKQGAALFKTEPFQALELFEQAAAEGSVSAMVGAGHCYETGTGAEVNYAKAVELYAQAVKQNSIKACEGLARIYASCPDPEFHDAEKAVRFAGAVARKSPRDSVALTLLAQAQARNMQFPEAGKTLMRAKRLASRDQLQELIRLQQNFEKGIPEPEAASEVWIMKAGDSGTSLWAMLQIAGWCSSEAHSMYDQKQARMWYARAAKRGSAEGALHYGRYCLRGIGGPAEIESAITAFEKSAESGEVEAYAYLGEIYFSNRAGKRDMDKAHKYFSQLEGTEDQTILFLIQALESSKRRSRMDSAEPEELYKSADFYSVPHTYTTYDIYGNPSGSSTTSARHSYALVYYLAAAESGYEPAMRKVASIYKFGVDNVSPDEARAALWLARLEEKYGKGISLTRPDAGQRTPTGSHSRSIELRKLANDCKYGRNGEEKNFEKALELFKQVYEMEKRGRDAFEIGKIYLWQKPWRDFDLAMKWLEIATNDKVHFAHQTLSDYYCRSYDKAARDADKAVAHAKIAVEWYRNSTTLSTLAAAYAFQGRYDLAVKAQEEVIEIAEKKKYHPNYIKHAKAALERYKKKAAEPSKPSQ